MKASHCRRLGSVNGERIFIDLDRFGKEFTPKTQPGIFYGFSTSLLSVFSCMFCNQPVSLPRVNLLLDHCTGVAVRMALLGPKMHLKSNNKCISQPFCLLQRSP